MARIIKFLPILTLIILIACSGGFAPEKAGPDAVYTSAAKTAVAFLTETSVARTKTAISWTPTPDITATPLPDAAVLPEAAEYVNGMCYFFWDELPEIANFPLMDQRIEGERCISAGDTFAILGQLNNCEFLKVQNQNGEQGWIVGPASNQGVIQFNKTCAELPAIYQRPQNGAYTGYGHSLLFLRDSNVPHGGANIFESRFFTQEAPWWWCNVSPCLVPDMYLGVVTIMNYLDTDALVILSPYFSENASPIFTSSQTMYIEASQTVSFPICDEVRLNKALNTWGTANDAGGGDLGGVRCFGYSDTGQYRIFAISGQNYDDIDHRFVDKPIYWSTTFILKVEQPIATHSFHGKVRVYFGVRDSPAKYYTIDSNIIILHPENSQAYFENNNVYGLAPISPGEFPSP
jgi:hypothetical protein